MKWSLEKPPISPAAKREFKVGDKVTLGVVGKPKRRCFQRSCQVSLVGDEFVLVKCPESAREMAFSKETLRYVKDCKQCMGCGALIVTASQQCAECTGGVRVISRTPVAYYIVT